MAGKGKKIIINNQTKENTDIKDSTVLSVDSELFDEKEIQDNNIKEKEIEYRQNNNNGNQEYFTRDKNFDYTKNQNIEDAQRNYESLINEKRGISTPEDKQKEVFVSRINYERSQNDDKKNIQNREINLAELYERSARGGASASLFTNEFGLSQDDIENLMSTRGLSHPSSVIYKISSYGQNNIRTVTEYATGTIFAGNDTGQGLRLTKEILSPMMFVASDMALRSITKSMQKNLADRLNNQAKEFNVFGKDTVFIDKAYLGIDTHELSVLEKELALKLNNAGISGLYGKDNDGILLQNKIRAILKKNNATLTLEEKGALNMLMSVAKTKTLNQSIAKGKIRFRRDLVKRSFRMIQQSDVGAGFVLSYNVITRTSKSIKLGSRAIRYGIKSAALVGKKTALAAVKGAVMLAKSKIGQQIMPDSVVNATKQTAQSINRISTGIDTLKQNIRNSRSNRMRQTFLHRRERIKAFRKDPFSLKHKRRVLLQNLRKTKVGMAVNGVFRPVSLAKQAAGYMISTVMSIVSAIMSAIMAAFGGILLLFLVVVIFIVIIGSIFSLFDFSAHDEKIQEAAFAQIKQCYQEQNNQIQSFYSQYRNVTINYQVKKDNELYADASMMTDISSNTNAAEIVSMAVVYFDFDLGKAGEEEVKNYVRKLYNGSHQYYVSETPVYKTNSEGEKYQIATDANITLTTHYFNSIFDCALAESSYGGTASFGSDMTGGDVAEKMFNYFKSAGWSDEAACAAIGNAAQESGGTLISGINPAIVGGGGRGVFGFTYSPDSHSADTGMGLVRYANSIGKDWTDLETQLQYFILCMNGTWGSMWNINSFTAKEFKNAGYHVPKVTFQQFTQISNLEDATMAFLCSYENCGIKNARWETRMRESRKAYALYANQE